MNLLRVLMCLFLVNLFFVVNAQDAKPLRLGVAGVTHGHLHEVFIRMDRGDFEVVGVAEPNEKYRLSNSLRKKLDASLS